MPGGEADFYDLLHLRPDASAGDIAAAYRAEQERYDPERARQLGDEFVAVATERRALLDQAFAVLHDPQRRFAYDRQQGLVGDEAVDRQGITNREVTYAVGGILVALALLAALWSAMGGRAPAGPAVSEVNYPAPPIALRTLDGGRFDLADHRGEVVLVNFWGTWCEPCKEETPALQAAYQKLADQGLVIVGVDLFDGEIAQSRGEQAAAQQAVARFANRYGVTYPIALDETGQVARDYKLYPIPVSYFIDQAGAVRFIRIGQLTTADVEILFRRLNDAVVGGQYAGRTFVHRPPTTDH